VVFILPSDSPYLQTDLYWVTVWHRDDQHRYG